jgi:hypothetical protein
METKIIKSTIYLQAGESVFVVCENEMQQRLHFNVSGSVESKSIKHEQVKVACHEALEFYPPELGCVTLESYVAQKLESLAYTSVPATEWLKVFKLLSNADIPLSMLPWEANCRLQLLLAILEHTEIVVLSHNLPVDQPGTYLHHVHRFCKRLDASFHSSFVIVAEELEPRWAWAVDHIYELETDGMLRELRMEI